ncbi:S1C family serine protease [Lederbergia citrea]|uniref:S1C family serine protease n=1 Tax=Lederbergia citrea TaxID=2833581 RepID=UPI001BC96CE2|nr:trypsin-like peptidase domain-containing protein [Lederbergia citrea]
MKEMNENNNIEKNRWQKGKPRLAKFLSTMGAGVIGSLLTLTAVANTSLFQAGEVSAPSAQTEKTNSYTVQQTSASTNSLADMVEHSSKAIVGIVNFQNESNRLSPFAETVERGSGSGVIFKKEGDNAFIVTNNHVIEGAEKLEISLENGEKTTAELVGADALSDLAVLKIDAKYAEAVLEFGDSDQLRAGDQVVAIGNPLGLDFSRTVTQGIVSAVNRSVNVKTSAGEWDLNVIQTDAAINPGNSGGALLNAEGTVIGINSLKIAENGVEGLGFAIPSNDAIPLIEEMIKHGQIDRPYMGVSLTDLEQIPRNLLQDLPEKVGGGTVVTALDSESAAAKAGVEVKDVIVEINGTEVKNTGDLRKFLYKELKAGDKVALKVYRGSEKKTIEITLASSKAIKN